MGDTLEWDAYTVLPFAGNQIKKMVQAGQTIYEGGAYKTNSRGEKLLQYPYFKDERIQSVSNATRVLAFGKSSLPQSCEWVENEYNTLSADKNERYSNAEIKTAIDSVFTTVENFALSSSQPTREQKAVLWQLITGSTSASSNPFGSYKIANEIVEICM